MPANISTPVNVGHVADQSGEKCSRCKAMLGQESVLNDDTGVMETHPWAVGQRVVEYETVSGRSGFAESVAGRTVDCIP